MTVTVRQDLQKAIAAAKAAQGAYAQFAEATVDQALKQTFQSMEKDMVRHLMQFRLTSSRSKAGRPES